MPPKNNKRVRVEDASSSSSVFFPPTGNTSSSSGSSSSSSSIVPPQPQTKKQRTDLVDTYNRQVHDESIALGTAAERSRELCKQNDDATTAHTQARTAFALAKSNSDKAELAVTALRQETPLPMDRLATARTTSSAAQDESDVCQQTLQQCATSLATATALYTTAQQTEETTSTKLESLILLRNQAEAAADAAEEATQTAAALDPTVVSFVSINATQSAMPTHTPKSRLTPKPPNVPGSPSSSSSDASVDDPLPAPRRPVAPKPPTVQTRSQTQVNTRADALEFMQQKWPTHAQLTMVMLNHERIPLSSDAGGKRRSVYCKYNNTCRNKTSYCCRWCTNTAPDERVCPICASCHLRHLADATYRCCAQLMQFEGVDNLFSAHLGPTAGDDPDDDDPDDEDDEDPAAET